MASELFVDNITGKTGTSGGAPITLSGDTATLGSGANIKAAFSSVDTSASRGPSGTDAGATTNTSLPIFGCRAFVNFDGSDVATVSSESHCKIRASGNISKVVRTGTGEFTIHFATAMPDTNYVACGMAGNDSATDAGRDVTFDATRATGSCSIRTTYHDSTATNAEVITVAFFR